MHCANDLTRKLTPGQRGMSRAIKLLAVKLITEFSFISSCTGGTWDVGMVSDAREEALVVMVI